MSLPDDLTTPFIPPSFEMSDDAIVALMRMAGWQIEYKHIPDFEGWHISPPGVVLYAIHETAQDALEYFLMHKRVHDGKP